VDQSNLNRQILHYDRDIGKKKVASAGGKLREINPDITIRTLDDHLDETNAGNLVGDSDGIVDALDNYSARYLLNRIALEKGIPLFHGAIRGMYGQATTIIPGKTPCLLCIFPKPPPPEVFPVIGVTPGLIGMVQATEVLKYLLGTGDLLTNRLFLWDGMAGQASEICVERNPCCAVCGDGRDKEAGRKSR
ncbi:MAG: HesA/MoeB/ThiF family protein, partial [Methanomicrobiales archaeon]|nr:HesA/MoeB/ThiF family protein [Methanomicrobiales archaeon]